MTLLTINLPDELVVRLRASAAARRQPLDTYVSEVLTVQTAPLNWLDDSLSFQDALAQFRALPPRPVKSVVRPLAKMLADTISDPGFDSEAWDRQWADIEADLKTVDETDRQADQLRDI